MFQYRYPIWQTHNYWRFSWNQKEKEMGTKTRRACWKRSWWIIEKTFKERPRSWTLWDGRNAKKSTCKNYIKRNALLDNFFEYKKYNGSIIESASQFLLYINRERTIMLLKWKLQSLPGGIHILCLEVRVEKIKVSLLRIQMVSYWDYLKAISRLYQIIWCIVTC